MARYDGAEIDDGRPMDAPGAPLDAPGYDIRGAARAIARELGAETIRGLHRASRALDALVFVGLWSVIASLFVGLGTLPVGPWWAALLVLQGFALQALAYLAHDLFVHRQAAGRWSASLAAFCLAPLTFSASEYRASHLAHHRHLGSPLDTEGYKADFDRRWVKLVYLVAPGALMIMKRRFRRAGTPLPPPPAHEPAVTARIQRERRAMLAFFGLVTVAAALWPRLVLLGYVLPIFVAVPAVSSLRLILEHGEMNPANPYHSSTCYRTGPLTRLLFFWSVGECHLVHHLFPGIPVYRLKAACDAMMPALKREGVIVRTSLPRLVVQWFILNRKHATVWES